MEINPQGDADCQIVPTDKRNDCTLHHQQGFSFLLAHDAKIEIWDSSVGAWIPYVDQSEHESGSDSLDAS